MASYKEKILNVIGEAEVGLTTVDVAKKAGVSKTTVIKYLSVLSSEGLVEFVEVGPSKLWRSRRTGIKQKEEKVQTLNQTLNVEALPKVDIDFCSDEDNAICFSFQVNLDQIIALLKRADKRMCKNDDLLIED
ncbi:MAG: IclR helix-turn-helix domain protein [Methanosaeta sp. PtaU1.Bin112]|nr:MAG: IclR helix-turn-helix domain protein [Methanosaeta sp. PtaU1.Bin112]